MRRTVWTGFVALAIGAPGCGNDGGERPGADAAEDVAQGEAVQDVGDGPCPADPPWLRKTFPWRCDLPGSTCTWPALGCAPGERPDNTCECTPGREWRCAEHFHNCLPVSGEGPLPPAGTRPSPPHRAVAEACAAVPPKEEMTCLPGASYRGAPGTCGPSTDCAGDGRCMQEAWFGPTTSCACVTSECGSDVDCGDDGVCVCGTVDPMERCDGLNPKRCLHHCVPATCRTDADCGSGELCSPSLDECGWQIEGYACHDPAADECFSDWECAPEERCRYAEGRWRCTAPLVCD